MDDITCLVYHDFTLDQHLLSPPPRGFYLLQSAQFYQMDKYTFISLYYLHILPAHQIFCL